MRCKHEFGISVVIPAYNRPEELINAIESVKTKYIDMVEIIVIDDGSDIPISSFLKDRNSSGVAVRIYANKVNSGPQVARNLGIRRSKFNYISFLDSDDVYLDTKMDWLVEELKLDNIDLLYHAVEGCEKYNKISYIWWKYFHVIFPFYFFICFLNPCVTPSLVVRKKLCLFNPMLRYSEDYAFILSYVKSTTKIKYVPIIQSKVSRRIGTIGGISSNLLKMRLGEFLGKRNILRRKDGVRKYIAYFLSFFSGSGRVVFDLLR